MQAKVYNVLFVCTGNSARSVMAECLLNAMAKGRFKAYSAGSHPGGKVNPLVIEHLEKNGISTWGTHSKSWDEFAKPGSPHMDFIVTVCDSAAGETCPIWSGHPVSAHWGVEDPAAHMDDPAKARKVIADAFHILRARISLLLALPVDKLERATLQSKMRDIGKAE